MSTANTVATPTEKQEIMKSLGCVLGCISLLLTKLPKLLDPFKIALAR